MPKRFKNTLSTGGTKTLIKFLLKSPEGNSGFVLIGAFSLSLGATKSHWSVAPFAASEAVVTWSVKVVKVNMPFYVFDFWSDKNTSTTLMPNL